MQPRLKSQYMEPKKGAASWRGISLSPEAYQVSENAVGREVVRLSQALDIRLVTPVPDHRFTSPVTPPATPHRAIACQHASTSSARKEEPQTPRYVPSSKHMSAEGINVPSPSSVASRKRKAGRLSAIEAARANPNPYPLVSPYLAHPVMPATVFRFSDPLSEYGINQSTGMRAGRYQYVHGRLPSAPPCTAEQMHVDIQVRSLCFVSSM